MTFTVTDALMSPMGLAVLSGAGLIKTNMDNQSHVHVTINVATDEDGKGKVTLQDLRDETGLQTATKFTVCYNTTEMPIYGTVLDGSGAGINWLDGITIDGATSGTDIDVTTAAGENSVTFVTGAAKSTVQLDFYLIMNNGVTEVTIGPDDFGGYFYVEAQTLFRREDDGSDMAANITIPRAKVQSGFTFTMASNGDPSESKRLAA